MTARDDFDPLAPQREAAFFYGLFLRGHDVDTLRQDIDVPHPMIEKWMKARDFEASVRFYEDLGFSVRRITDGLAEMQLGAFTFLLQAFEAPGYADNFMMQMLVNDLSAWWARIEALDLANRYGVRPPKALCCGPSALPRQSLALFTRESRM